MKLLLTDINGTQLRIIKFLYGLKKGSTSVTRGNIVSRLYITNGFPGNQTNVDDDINILIDRELIKREDKYLWLTELAFIQFSKYKNEETKLILNDLIDVNYEFALLRYLNRRREYVNLYEFPKILVDFAPFLNNLNQPSGMLADNLYKLNNYIEEKNKWYKLNEYGKQYLRYLVLSRKKEKRKEELENIILKDTISNTRFQRRVTYISLGIAFVAGIIPLILYFADQSKKVQVEIPEIKQLLQTHQSLLKSIQELNKTYQSKDSSKLK